MSHCSWARQKRCKLGKILWQKYTGKNQLLCCANVFLCFLETRGLKRRTRSHPKHTTDHLITSPLSVKGGGKNHGVMCQHSAPGSTCTTIWRPSTGPGHSTELQAKLLITWWLQKTCSSLLTPSKGKDLLAIWVNKCLEFSTHKIQEKLNPKYQFHNIMTFTRQTKITNMMDWPFWE